MSYEKLLAAQGALATGMIERLGPETSREMVEYALSLEAKVTWQGEMLERVSNILKRDRLSIADEINWLADLAAGPKEGG